MIKNFIFRLLPLMIFLINTGCISIIDHFGHEKKDTILVYQEGEPVYPLSDVTGPSASIFRKATFFNMVRNEFRNLPMYKIQDSHQFVKEARVRGIPINVELEGKILLNIRKREVIHLSWPESSIDEIINLAKSLGIRYLISTKLVSGREENIYIRGRVFLVTIRVKIFDVYKRKTVFEKILLGQSRAFKTASSIYRVGLTTEINWAKVWSDALLSIVSQTANAMLALENPTTETILKKGVKTVFLFSFDSQTTLGQLQRITPIPLDEKYQERTVFQRVTAHINSIPDVKVIDEFVLNAILKKEIPLQVYMTTNNSFWIGPINLLRREGSGNCPTSYETINHLALADTEILPLRRSLSSLGIDWMVGYKISHSGWKVRPNSGGQFSGFAISWNVLAVDNLSGSEFHLSRRSFQESKGILGGIGLNLGGIQITPFHGKVDGALKAMAIEIIKETKNAFERR